MSDVADATILFIGLMTIALAGLLLYLITLLSRIERLLAQLRRYVRREVHRDGDGRPLYERTDR